jgi:hypothetical protein
MSKTGKFGKKTEGILGVNSKLSREKEKPCVIP